MKETSKSCYPLLCSCQFLVRLDSFILHTKKKAARLFPETHANKWQIPRLDAPHVGRKQTVMTVQREFFSRFSVWIFKNFQIICHFQKNHTTTPTQSVDLKEKNLELIAKKLNAVKHFKRGFYLHKCGELQLFLSHFEVRGMEQSSLETTHTCIQICVLSTQT